MNPRPFFFPNNIFPTALILLITAIGLLSGCASQLLDPPKDAVRYFLLLNENTPEGTPPQQRAIEITAVRVPDFLRSDKMVVRSGSHEIEFRAFQRWAEAPETAFPRMLQKALDAQQMARQLQPGPAPLQLLVDLEHFEGTTGGTIAFSGSWQISGLPGGSLRRNFNLSDARYDPRDPAQLAEALSKGIQRLGAQIVHSLTTLPISPPPGPAS